MIHLLPLVAAVAVAGASFVVGRSADPRSARARAVGALLAVAVALAVATILVAAAGVAHRPLPAFGMQWELACPDWHAAAPFVYLLVGLLAVALAPAASHPPRTLGDVLRLVAVSTAFVAFESALPLVVLWAGSVGLFARGLGRVDGGLRRAFLRYQLPGLAFASVGAGLIAAGRGAEGAVCWLVAIFSREAIAPFHGWLPLVAGRAPLGLLAAFVGPQLGVHAHLALVADAVPHAAAHAFAWAGGVTAVLGAAIGLAQSEARAAIAWIVVSQTGLVAFGLENASDVGRTGAVLTWQVSAIAVTGFLMTAAALEARRGALSLREPGGSFARTPRMATSFLFLGFASVGLPLTLGFVAEDLLVQGSVDEFPALVFGLLLATALNGINVLRCFFTLFSGKRDHIGEQDLGVRERLALTLAMALLLLGGVFPRAFVPPPARNAGGAPAHDGQPHGGAGAGHGQQGSQR
jgi:NADH:ubiquinone oxidoreductase subunit 5 (subunit L)/multisubunit Na+/H+ antiporter MnhA subunit